ncbi:uncharacterized protein LOC125678444 [Ostrea edulis]|uniref:uncharacterized protein LOC125678444 n=1 Tax=Ostrea edulis TaxID=37623 RepID=UPI00209533D4|nr:uncharacterized protein LOC125678444 [Ostrea edulis]XP_056011487.1 uncharacterized protein LOC125678444 [Ostrea edulis]
MAEIQFAQDIIRCDICPTDVEKEAAEIFCKSCKKHLCQSCVGKHVLSSKMDHIVVKFLEHIRVRTLISPTVIRTVDSGYIPLSRVVKSRDEYMWTSADMNTMKKLDLNGIVIETISSGSIHSPFDIALNKMGELMFTVSAAKVLNVIRGQKAETLITVTGGWTPRGLCSTAKDEILVSMFKAGEADKIVRYSGVTIIQEIWRDSNGHFLFRDASYVCENANSDICVSDADSHCVIVVNSSGIPRYKYTGGPQSQFEPGHLACDRYCHILIADRTKHCIHITDKDGKFMLLVDRLLIQAPVGIFIDDNDMMYVAERKSGKIKMIRYMND